MTTERTLRRKLQKKKKRRPYGRCCVCQSRTERRVRHLGGSWVIVEVCKGVGCGSKRVNGQMVESGRHIR